MARQIQKIYGILGEEKILLGQIELPSAGPGNTETPIIDLVNNQDKYLIYLSGFNNYDFGCFCGMFELLGEDGECEFFFFDNMDKNGESEDYTEWLLYPIKTHNCQPYNWYIKEVAKKL
jgi:hypothetical protein